MNRCRRILHVWWTGVEGFCMCDEPTWKNFACVMNRCKRIVHVWWTGVEEFCMCDEPVLKNFACVINRCRKILHLWWTGVEGFCMCDSWVRWPSVVPCRALEPTNSSSRPKTDRATQNKQTKTSLTAQLGYYCCCLNFNLSVHSLRIYATCINRVYIWSVYCCYDKMCFPLIKLSWLTERKTPRSFLPFPSVSPHFIQSHILCGVHMRV